MQKKNKKLIGAKTYLGFSIPDIKRELLFFDKIAYFFPITEWFDFIEKLDKHLGAEFHWLWENGLIFEVGKNELSEKIQSKVSKDSKLRKLIELHNILFKELNGQKSPDSMEKTMYYLRILTLVYQQIYKNWDCIPIFGTSKFPDEKSYSRKSDVLHIIIESLPIPDEQTSWEQIYDFKSDLESREKLYELRHWMMKMAKADLSANEIQEELEWLLHSYEKLMKLHCLKHKKGAIEVLVTSSAELIENIIKLRFSRIAKSLFSVRHKRIALLEAEMKSPGYEISYISKTKDRYSKK